MPGLVRTSALLVALAAAATAGAAVDLSGTWSLAGKGRDHGPARPGAAPFSLTIAQDGETITLGFGRNDRWSMTLRADGAPRPFRVNGSPTRATVAARWQGDDLIVELIPGRPGLAPVRSVWRKLDAGTLQIEGGLPGAGGHQERRNLVLTLQPGEGHPAGGGDR